jgi:hypothetical protein
MTDFEDSVDAEVDAEVGAAGTPVEPVAEATAEEVDTPGVELHRMSRRLGEKVRHARGTTARILRLMD